MHVPLSLYCPYFSMLGGHNLRRGEERVGEYSGNGTMLEARPGAGSGGGEDQVLPVGKNFRFS